MLKFPFSLLSCPNCKGVLQLSQEAQLQCSSCLTCYSIFQGAPWLFPVPDQALGFWRDNLMLHIQQIDSEVLAIKNSCDQADILPSQKTRLKKWAEAKKEFARSLERILSPLSSDSNPSIDVSIALRDTIPMTQRLGSYLDNVFRDWSWGDENGENKESLAILLELLKDTPPPEKLIVLGAGACRLAYDLHRAKNIGQTLVSDINPLYLFLAQDIISGGIKSLHEFPISPIDGKSFFVRRELKSPEPLNDNFYFVFADGMNPPFQAAAFDCLLTPWFIDIVPQDPRTLFKRFNFLLEPGGIWLNFGSCYFNHPDFARRYSPEEILQIAEDSGFKITQTVNKKLPYLQNPASGHGRIEQTLSFIAKKVRDVVQPPKYSYLPEWLLDPSKPIPVSPVFTQFAAVHGFYTQVVSAIDGQTSLETMAKTLGPKFGLTEKDGINSFGRFLTKIYETGLVFHGSGPLK